MSNTVDYTFFNTTRGEPQAATPADLTRTQQSNLKYSQYMLDNPLVSYAQQDSVLLFAAQQHLIPIFSVNGAVSFEKVDTDTELKHFKSDTAPTPTYFRLGSTTPYLARGTFLTDTESQLQMAEPTIRNKT